MPTKAPRVSEEDAELLALQALAFLAQEPARLAYFLRLTGLNPQELQRIAGERSLMSGVLEHLLADQSLLLVFAAETRVAPESVALAHAKLASNH